MQSEFDKENAKEIGLRDIVDFLAQHYRRILLVTAVVLALAFAYALTAPKKFEAVFMLQMARVPKADSAPVVVESPARLGERMRRAATYSKAALDACGMGGRDSIGEYLGGMVKFGLVKSIVEAAEVKVRGSSPESSRQCAEALVAMIRQQQQSLIADQLLGKKEQLAGYQKEMAAELQQMETLKKSQLSNLGYLAKLEKLSWLRGRIDLLQEELMLESMHPAALMMPMSVTTHPVSPNTRLIMLLGLLAGLMLGTFAALIPVAWRKYFATN